MIYKQTGNIAVNIEQLKYAPLFAGEKDIFKFTAAPSGSLGRKGRHVGSAGARRQ